MELADLRAPTPVVREQIVERPTRPGDELVLRYQLRNSSQRDAVTDVVISGSVPPGLTVSSLPDGFSSMVDVSTDVSTAGRADIPRAWNFGLPPRRRLWTALGKPQET